MRIPAPVLLMLGTLLALAAAALVACTSPTNRAVDFARRLSATATCESQGSYEGTDSALCRDGDDLYFCQAGPAKKPSCELVAHLKPMATATPPAPKPAAPAAGPGSAQ